MSNLLRNNGRTIEDTCLLKTVPNPTIREVLSLIGDILEGIQSTKYYNFSLIQADGTRISHFFSPDFEGRIKLESIEHL